MALRRLFVHHARGRVAMLETRDGSLQLTYEPGWRQSGFPISQSLPLQAPPHHAAAHFFFANLLPEAQVRRQVCQRLGISADNDFELLAAIGGECAGALVITEQEQLPPRKKPRYRELDAKTLQKLASTQALGSVSGTGGARLSLAGAQDKLPVVVDGDRLLLPLDDAPSTHILKFPNRDFANLPANEVLMGLIASRLGLPVAPARLLKVQKTELCLVERYDRVRGPDGDVERLHQEDLCQALGLAPITKYEHEGGPGFARCFALVRTVSSQPLRDAVTLVDALVFNVIAFNADAHAKNVSLLYDGQGATQLAPLYDLVCTRAYPRLARDLAMAVDGVFDPTQVMKKHWQHLAATLELGAGFVLQRVHRLTEAFGDATAEAARELRERYGDSPALQQVLPKVRRQAKRIARQA